jgi:tellurite resistance protein TehA-like permease
VLYFSLEDETAASTAGAVVIGMLAGAAGLEGFANFCLGCLFFSWGIRFKLIPSYVYTIHNNSRDEIEASWHYKNDPSKAPKPTKVDTNPDDAAALKYKVKTDEWTKDDFHLVRNMAIGYFGMPVGLAGLALVWKFLAQSAATIQAPVEVFQVIGVAAAVVYCIMFVLYGARLVLHRNKCAIEWDCPLRAPSFGLVTIALMLFSMLIVDQGGVDEERFARVLWWLGAVPHMLMTIAKFGEWVGKRLELEHVHATWLILPVGNLVAAAAVGFVTPLEFESASANTQLGHFFYSFAFFMWLTLFAITLLKVATTHNSDDRIRHSVFIWIAAPSVAAIAQYMLCTREVTDVSQLSACTTGASQLYYIALVLTFGMAWATLVSTHVVHTLCRMYTLVFVFVPRVV